MTPQEEFSSHNWQSLSQTSFLKSVEVHTTLPSTNSYALEHLSEYISDRLPKLILTEHQTAGRGRGEHRWWSQKGSLTFSLIVSEEHFSIPTHLISLISLRTGLAVSRTLQQLIKDTNHRDGADGISPVKLKWPNDVLLEGKKIAGILIETEQREQQLCLVIGVGINLNVKVMGAPEEIEGLAISLAEVLGEELSFFRTMELFLAEFSHAMGLSTAELQSLWSDYCYLTNHRVSLQQGEHVISGICQGIGEQGELLIESQSGIQRVIQGVVTSISEE